MKEFEKGRAFHLWLGYGSMIYLFFYVLSDLLNRRFDNLFNIIAIFIFGVVSLYLGYYEKKELKNEN